MLYVYRLGNHQLNDQATMLSLRLARAAVRARPAAVRTVLQARTYADAAPDKVCVLPISKEGLEKC
jgi:hypothetical protein